MPTLTIDYSCISHVINNMNNLRLKLSLSRLLTSSFPELSPQEISLVANSSGWVTSTSEAGKLRGACCARFHGKTIPEYENFLTFPAVCLCWLMVSPEFRNQGIAKQLVATHLEKNISSETSQIKSFFTFVKPDNFASLKVFHFHNFTPVGQNHRGELILYKSV